MSDSVRGLILLNIIHCEKYLNCMLFYIKSDDYNDVCY